MMRTIVIVGVSFLCFPLWAQLSKEPTTVGLTLSGGGAKGLAHIGILKALEEQGIYPSFISGTSMGSIVGGLYAMGYNAKELEALAQNLQWNDYFNDTYNRKFTSIEEKMRTDRYQLSLAYDQGKLKIPKGFIQGKKIKTLLSILTIPVHGHSTFDKFCTPFTCVATNLATGHPVVFKKGDLASSLRASMSIPSVFAPFNYEDQILVDGMLVRNLPVQEVKDMGARFVIAVDVGAPLRGMEQISTVLDVLDQSSSFAGVASTYRQRELANFIFDPELGDLGASDFDKTDALIEKGYDTGRECVADLVRLMDEKGIPRYSQSPRPKFVVKDRYPIVEIEYQGTTSVANILKALSKVSVGDTLNNSDLESMISRLYGSNFFNEVDFRLLPNGDGYTLVLMGEGGYNNFFRGGINYDNNLDAALLLNYTNRNALMDGSIFSLDVRASQNPAVLAEYLIYTQSEPSIGLRAMGIGHFYNGEVFFNYKALDQYRFQHYTAQLSLLSGLADKFHVELGWAFEQINQNLRFFSPFQEESALNRNYLMLNMVRDTKNRTYFPTEGSYTRWRTSYDLNGSINKDVSSSIPLTGNITSSLEVDKVFPIEQTPFLMTTSLRTGMVLSDQYDYLNLFYLGRSIPYEYRPVEVVGLRFLELPATAYGVFGVKWQYRFPQDYLIGLTYNYGYSWLSSTKILKNGKWGNGIIQEGSFNGLGVELGAVTRLGPLRFSLEYLYERNSFNFALQGGFPF